MLSFQMKSFIVITLAVLAVAVTANPVEESNSKFINN